MPGVVSKLEKKHVCYTHRCIPRRLAQQIPELSTDSTTHFSAIVPKRISYCTHKSFPRHLGSIHLLRIAFKRQLRAAIAEHERRAVGIQSQGTGSTRRATRGLRKTEEDMACEGILGHCTGDGRSPRLSDAVACRRACKVPQPTRCLPISVVSRRECYQRLSVTFYPLPLG